MNIINKPNSKLIFLMIFCAGLGGILYGYDIGVISGALLLIKQTITLTENQLGLIVGAVLSGSILGTLLTGPLADRYGRRTMIIAACFVFIAGLLLILIAQGFTGILAARLLIGTGVGIVSVAVPLYLSEVAPAAIRGRSVAIFQLLLTFGILLAYIIDFFFIRINYSWRSMFAVIFIPVLIMLCSMYFLPETPRFLLFKGLTQKAKEVLLKTRGTFEAEQELASIQDALKHTTGSWATLLKPCFWWPMGVALLIAISNQLTGINVLLQYAPIVIKNAGLTSHLGSMLGTTGIGLVNFIGTIISFFLVDHFGRRRLLLIGTIGITISYLYLAVLAFVFSSGSTQAIFALIGLFSYIVFFAIGPGVVVWLAISELMPTVVRGKVIALSLFFNSLTAAILSTVFLTLETKLGMSGTYLLFAVFTTFYFLVVYFGLPETKKKTLEEIQQFFQHDLK